MAANVAAGANPWLADWNALRSQGYAQLGASPRPLVTVVRGGTGQNFAQMYIDIERAYDTALEWKVTGNTAYADQTITFLNAWASTNTTLTGDADRFLASGLYGFQWANVAQIMQSYSGWAAADQSKFQNYLLNVYYPMNHDFLVNHNGAYITNYWANWDLCNIASEMAIGIFTNRHDIYDEALNYIYNGGGNGAFDKAIYYTHPGNLGQGQEEGRDQGHSNLDFAMLGEICQTAWNQGDDLFSYHNNAVLAGAEYLAKYNLGHDVPFEDYEWGNGQSGAFSYQGDVSSGSRGQLRPIFELIYNHYVNIEGLAAPYTAQALAQTRPEGDNGNGDEYSWGTLAFALDPITTPQAPTGLTAYEKGKGNIQLNWWGGANDTSYSIYRATSASGQFVQMASGLTDPLTYTDRNLPAGTYFYKVTGVSGEIETAASNVVQATSSNLLIAQLAFDEASGTSAADSSGNGVTGTLIGGASFAAGKSGNAVSLDGSTGYVALPAGLNATLSDFTIATWVYLNSSQTWSRIFDFGDSRGNWMFLTPRDGAGKVEFSTSSTYGYNKQSVIGNAALPTNQWVHVAVTFSDRLATIFVNGVAVGSNANMDFPPYEIGGTLPNAWIGRSQFAADPYLNGKVDDFRIYRGAMSAGQIYTLATGTAAPVVPAAPANFSATAVVGNQINLSWANVSGATSYSIYRSTTDGGPYTPIATLVSSTSYADTQLAAGTTYYYVVAAANLGGDGVVSLQASATALPPMPGVPSGVIAKATSTSTVALTWSAASNAASYTIRRANVSGGPYVTLASGVTATNYTDTSAANGITYYYVVDADNAAGESAHSSEVTATPSDVYLLLKMDDGSGTTALDSTGNGDNATLVNGPTWSTSGKLNSAVALDGVDDYLSLPTGITTGMNSVTLAAWVNLDTISTWSRIFDFGTGTSNYMFLSPKGGSNVVRFAIKAGGGEQQINGTAALTAGSWTHVAVTLSGSVGVLYVNGVEVGRNSAMTLTPASLGITTQNYIGKSQFADPALAGRVDDFRIYGRVLSASEISTLMNAVIPTAPTGLSAITGDTKATLNWTATNGATSYIIKRATVSGGPYTTIAAGVTGTSYVDTGLTNQSTYYYVVVGSSMASDSAASVEASVTPTSAPTIANVAAATPNPVTGTQTALSVTGADDGGEANLTYTWSLTGTPPASVTFNSNGTNAAKNTTATFTKAGMYNFQVTVTDSAGFSTTSEVAVTVNQALTSLTVSPSSNPTVSAGNSQQFTAAGIDQFGQKMSVSPTWTATGGTITSMGLFTAGNTAGNFTVTATSSSISNSVPVTVNVPVTPLFTGQADIGTVGLAGSYSTANGVYTVKGAGSDIWSSSDSFHYVYLPFTGDGQIIARVSAVQNNNSSAKAGVMFRETLAAGAKNAMLGLYPSNGLLFQRRPATNSSTSRTTKSASVPTWVKLVRSGSVFQAFYSANGTSWTQLGSNQTITMASSIYVGLAVTSHTTTALNTSTFDNVSVTQYSNLALGKVAAATSTATGSSAGNAIDGNAATAWKSAAAGSQNLTIDLGSTRNVSHVQVNWGTNYATRYSIQISSNNSTWTTLYSTTSGTGGVVDVAGLFASGRYVRITLTAAKSTTYVLNDVLVMGL